MTKKTEDSQRFSKMIGANIKFLRLSQDRFMPQKVPAGSRNCCFDIEQ